MSFPILSIIIPTANRELLLKKAINSALSITEDCEVIVVPNGVSLGWKKTAKIFDTDDRVKWLPIMEANVSAARNHGLIHAKGIYIRFLDDDDFFYPNECLTQLNLAVSEQLDIVSGAVRLIDAKNEFIEDRRMLQIDDFCTAVFHPSRCVQVGAHLYKRSVVAGLRWNEQRSLNEDMEWLFDVACLVHLRWKTVDSAVSAWVQHDGERLSRGKDPGDDTLKYSANIILNSFRKLKVLAELTPRRREALSDGLWSLLQKGLRYDFDFWINVAKFSDQCSAGRRPPSKIHRTWPFTLLHPLTLEKLLIPVRNLYARIRRNEKQIR